MRLDFDSETLRALLKKLPGKQLDSSSQRDQVLSINTNMFTVRFLLRTRQTFIEIIESSGKSNQNAEDLVHLKLNELNKVMAAIPRGVPVELTIGKEQKLSVKAGQRTFQVNAVDAASEEDKWKGYNLLTTPQKTICTLPAKQLTEIVKKMIMSASRDEARPQLCGVNIEKDGRDIVFVSTDSYRLGVQTLEWKNAYKLNPLLVPARALSEWARVFDGNDDTDVSLSWGKVKTESVAVLSWDVNGFVNTWFLRTEYNNFPDWRKLIPDDGSVFSFDSDELIDAVTTIKKVSDRDAPVIFDGEKNTISNTDNMLNVPTTVQLEHTKFEVDNGWSGRIAFNPAYLLDGIKAAGANRVSVTIVDELKAAKIQGTDDYEYLLMPVRI